MFFTGLRQIHAQVRSGLDAIKGFQTDYLALRKRLTAAEARVSELDEQVSTLSAALHKLRGQVHGPKAQQKGRGGVDEIPFGDKEALRAAAGLQHNTRFTHPEE